MFLNGIEGQVQKLWRIWVKSMKSNLKSTIIINNYVYTGLEKNLNSSLPFGQVALKFCLPWASLRLLFVQFSWQTTCLGK